MDLCNIVLNLVLISLGVVVALWYENLGAVVATSLIHQVWNELRAVNTVSPANS